MKIFGIAGWSDSSKTLFEGLSHAAEQP